MPGYEFRLGHGGLEPDRIVERDDEFSAGCAHLAFPAYLFEGETYVTKGIGRRSVLIRVAFGGCYGGIQVAEFEAGRMRADDDVEQLGFRIELPHFPAARADRAAGFSGRRQ